MAKAGRWFAWHAKVTLIMTCVERTLFGGQFAHNGVAGILFFDSLICDHCAIGRARPSCQADKEWLDPARRHDPGGRWRRFVPALVELLRLNMGGGTKLWALRLARQQSRSDRRWHRLVVFFPRLRVGSNLWDVALGSPWLMPIHTCMSFDTVF